MKTIILLFFSMLLLGEETRIKRETFTIKIGDQRKLTKETFLDCETHDINGVVIDACSFSDSRGFVVTSISYIKEEKRYKVIVDFGTKNSGKKYVLTTGYNGPIRTKEDAEKELDILLDFVSRIIYK